MKEVEKVEVELMEVLEAVEEEMKDKVVGEEMEEELKVKVE